MRAVIANDRVVVRHVPGELAQNIIAVIMQNVSEPRSRWLSGARNGSDHNLVNIEIEIGSPSSNLSSILKNCFPELEEVSVE